MGFGVRYKKKTKLDDVGYRIVDKFYDNNSVKKKEPTKSKVETLLEGINFDLLLSDEHFVKPSNIKTSKRKSKKPNRESEDFYEQRFDGELKIYQNILEETILYEKEASEFLARIKGSGLRNIKAITDMYNNVNQTKKLVLDSVDKIASIKKTISDLEQKRARINGGVEGGSSANNDLMIAEIFKKLQDDSSIKTGREFYNPTTVDYMDDFNDSQMFLNRERELLDSGELQYTSEEQNLDFIGRDISIYVIMNEDSNEWRLAAIDEGNNSIVEGYSLPLESSLGKMTFYRADDQAVDDYGRTYKLMVLDDDLYKTY